MNGSSRTRTRLGKANAASEVRFYATNVHATVRFRTFNANRTGREPANHPRRTSGLLQKRNVHIRNSANAVWRPMRACQCGHSARMTHREHRVATNAPSWNGRPSRLMARGSVRRASSRRKVSWETCRRESGVPVSREQPGLQAMHRYRGNWPNALVRGPLSTGAALPQDGQGRRGSGSGEVRSAMWRSRKV